jgi:hypothetical protein
MSSPDPAGAYRSVVSDILDARRPTIPYPTGAPELSIVNARRPFSAAELAPAEVTQLSAAWYEEEDGATLDDVLANEEYGVEAAEVVDASGRLRYRLYGWNYGVGYLFGPDGLDLVVFGAQHDLEHWSAAQRDLFAGLDRALRAGGHGFAQPLHFCWDDDSCWAQLAGAEPHTVGSEPYLRSQLARFSGKAEPAPQ